MKNTTIEHALQTLIDAINQENDPIALDSPVHFKDKVYNKGMLWSGIGHTKQFVLIDKPDRFFSSENIDLAKDKELSINKVKILDENELGPSVVKSNLKEVGRLRGLVVDGALSVNQYLYFDNHTDRLGLGTDEPNAALSIAEDDIEIVIGTDESSTAYIGTYASHAFELKTDNKSRIKVDAGGNIQLGNDNSPPINVKINGSLGIGVNNADPNVDLHVRGSVKFNNHLQTSGTQPPDNGVYSQGDIVWNNKPKQKGCVGWVCIKGGTPGLWAEFGEIR